MAVSNSLTGTGFYDRDSLTEIGKFEFLPGGGGFIDVNGNPAKLQFASNPATSPVDEWVEKWLKKNK